MPRLVGFQAAKELIMSGRQMTATEALELRLADKVLEPDDLLPTALKDAAEWAKGPTSAYWAVKKAMADGFGLSIDAGLEVEREAFEEVFKTGDAKSGILAFVNKDEAEFTGS